MNLKIAAAVCLSAVFLSGCSDPGRVAPGEFQRQYAAAGRPQTMREVTYLGKKDGKAFLRVRAMPLTGGTWKEEVIHADLSKLEPGFRAALPEKEMK